MATKEQLVKRIKAISKQMTGEIDDSDDNLLPCYCIKGQGEGYFLSYTDRNFIKIPRQTEVYIVAEDFDYMGRYLVYTYSHELIIIDKDELQYIGYN